MARHYKLIAVVAVCLIIALVIGWQLTLRPQIEMSGASVTEFSPSLIKANLLLDLHNPYLIGLNQTLDVNLLVDQSVVASVDDFTIDLPAMSDSMVTIPVSINPVSFGRSGLVLLLEKNLPLKIEGTLKYSVFGFPMTIPMEKSFTIVREGTSLSIQS